jgi:hypothetical protein
MQDLRKLFIISSNVVGTKKNIYILKSVKELKNNVKLQLYFLVKLRLVESDNKLHNGFNLFCNWKKISYRPSGCKLIEFFSL